MNRTLTEAPVSLEDLDEHHKALLRLKLREFVHLSPWFKHIPSIDLSLFPAVAASTARSKQAAHLHACPNRRQIENVRRHTRQSVCWDGLNY
jgi:hypothetical protein